MWNAARTAEDAPGIMTNMFWQLHRAGDITRPRGHNPTLIPPQRTRPASRNPTASRRDREMRTFGHNRERPIRFDATKDQLPGRRQGGFQRESASAQRAEQTRGRIMAQINSSRRHQPSEESYPNKRQRSGPIGTHPATPTS